MSYSRMPWMTVPEHIDSDDWTCGERTMRIHRYRCTRCNGEFIYADGEFYECCPYCTFALNYTRGVTK